MRPLPPLLFSFPPLALIILLPMDRNTLEPAVEAIAQPCWSRDGQRQCQPLPKSMLEFMEIGGAEIIRTVFPTKIAPLQVTKINKSTAILQRHILTFQIPEPAKGEVLESAELRLTLPWNLRGQKWLGKKDMAHVFLMPDSHEIGIQSTTKLDSSPIKYVPQKHHNNSISFSPRVSLNVTAALFPKPLMQQIDGQMEKPEGLLNLELHLQGNRKSLRQAMPKKLKDENTRFRTNEDPPQLLLFYSLDGQPINSSSKRDDYKWRWKRSVKGDFEEETNMIWNEKADVGKFKEWPGIKRKQPRNSCRRQPLYVDFAEINYDTWIVAPSGYEAYQCVGKCFFPVSDHLSPTKHAILQTLVHSAFPRKAARACCVPTRLEPISVLYVDQNGVLTYHFNYDDMVVAECGCR